MINENLLKMVTISGNEMSDYIFFDVQNHRVSPKYLNVIAVGFEKAAYFSIETNGNWSFVVSNIFSPMTDRIEFDMLDDLNFYGTTKTGLDPEMSQQFIHCPISEAVFLDKNHLFISYLNGQKQFVEKILDLT